MTMQIFDDFLEPGEFNQMQRVFLSEEFPWFYNNNVVCGQGNRDLFQMCHTFYYAWEWRTDYRNLIAPVVNQLDILQPLRIKANLTFKMDKNYEGGYHIDFNAKDIIQKNKTAIFYVTTTDGPTLFEDGTKCDCVENRLVLFDNGIQHSGTFATDAKQRVVVNFNFYTP